MTNTSFVSVEKMSFFQRSLVKQHLFNEYKSTGIGYNDYTLSRGYLTSFSLCYIDTRKFLEVTSG